MREKSAFVGRVDGDGDRAQPVETKPRPQILKAIWHHQCHHIAKLNARLCKRITDAVRHLLALPVGERSFEFELDKRSLSLALDHRVGLCTTQPVLSVAIAFRPFVTFCASFIKGCPRCKCSTRMRWKSLTFISPFLPKFSAPHAEGDFWRRVMTHISHLSRLSRGLIPEDRNRWYRSNGFRLRGFTGGCG